jgi:hypothetical protein
VVDDIVCGVLDMVALSPAGAAALRRGGMAGIKNSGKYCERVCA